jgi:hypothetical protein
MPGNAGTNFLQAPPQLTIAARGNRVLPSTIRSVPHAQFVSRTFWATKAKPRKHHLTRSGTSQNHRDIPTQKQALIESVPPETSLGQRHGDASLTQIIKPKATCPMAQPGLGRRQHRGNAHTAERDKRMPAAFYLMKQTRSATGKTIDTPAPPRILQNN